MACIADYFILDDQILKTEEFDISILEKGFSIYEVVKIIDGIPLFIEDHTNRLHQSAKLKAVNIGFSDKYIKDTVYELININEIIDGRLKYAIRYHESGNIFISFFLENIEPPPEVYQKGVSIISELHQRESPNAKVINYTLRKRIKRIISEKNVFETLLVNESGKITECSKSNIFFIKDDIVYTSYKDDVLPGITRKYIIQLCHEHNIQIKEKNILYDELNEYQSAFITGTSIGLLSTVKIDSFSFDRNHKILQKLSSAYNSLVKKYIQESKKSYKG